MESSFGYDIPQSTLDCISTWSETQATVFLAALEASVHRTAVFAVLPSDEPKFDELFGLEPGSSRMYFESLVDAGALLQGAIPNIYVVSRDWAKHPDFVEYPKVYTEFP